jgi:L,D-transpeptidase catalytic domain
MFKTRTLLFSLLLFLTLAWLDSSGLWEKTKTRQAAANPRHFVISPTRFEKMKIKALEAKLFVQGKGYNSFICLFADMSLSSGRDRLFVYDMEKDTIKNSGLVTHGRCNEWWLEGRKYGNEVGCGCTSLGKYKIGHSYNGRFGLAYKLYGLDKTNDNAFKRFVVLHSHTCVPETEVKDDICQSDGCPTVSVSFLQYLKPIIDESKKPILLWIYD